MRQRQVMRQFHPLAIFAGALLGTCWAISTTADEVKHIPTPPPPVADVKSEPPPIPKSQAHKPAPLPQTVEHAGADVEAGKRFQAPNPSAAQFNLTQPLYDIVDDSLWVRGQSYKAQFSPDGVTYIPFLGATAPQNYPVRFQLQSISIGQKSLTIANTMPHRSGETIVYDRGAVHEIYHIDLDSIEQTFVLQQRPAAAGDLVIQVDVSTELAKSTIERAFQFSNNRGGVSYSHAVVIDAERMTSNLQTRLVGNHIEITLPAPLIAAAKFPITVDPVISTFSVYAAEQINLWPDIAYDATDNSYLYVWENQFSATDGDIFSRRVSLSGAWLDPDPVYVDFTGDNWRKPKVANNNLANNYLVVAEKGAAPNRVIWGRTRNANSPTMSAQFQIGDPLTHSRDQINPSVGGDPATVGPTYFLVMWTRVWAATDHDVHARMVNSNATNFGAVMLIDNSTAHDLAPSISKSNGLPPFATQNWTIVWSRRAADNDYDIYGTQIRWDGAVTHSNYFIDLFLEDHRNPSVSTLYPEDIPGGERVYIIAYEELDTGDIVARGYRGTKSEIGYNLTFLENADLAAVRRNAVVEITTNYRFVVAYEQQFSANDWDIYVSQYCASFGVRISESHRNLARTESLEWQPRMAGTYVSGGGINEFKIAWAKSNSVTLNGEIVSGTYNPKNSCCVADVTDDGQVNVNDLLAVINQWTVFCMNCSADVNGDRQVNVNDLLAVINAWGSCF